MLFSFHAEDGRRAPLVTRVQTCALPIWQFDYAFTDAKNGCMNEVTTFFNAQGAGRDVFRALCGASIYGDVKQCWDAGGCLTFVDDPFGFTPACLGLLLPCVLGVLGQCPAGL